MSSSASLPPPQTPVTSVTQGRLWLLCSLLTIPPPHLPVAIIPGYFIVLCKDLAHILASGSWTFAQMFFLNSYGQIQDVTIHRYLLQMRLQFFGLPIREESPG